MNQLYLDSIGVDEIENRAQVGGNFSDLRPSNTAPIDPVCPRGQLIQRADLQREMIQAGMDGVKRLTAVVLVLAQIEDAAAQPKYRHVSRKKALSFGSFGDQKIRAEHVAVKPDTAVDACHRYAQVMKSGYPWTCGVIFHALDDAIGDHPSTPFEDRQ